MKKSEHQLRVTPKIWIGLLIAVGYLCIIIPIQILSGIPYQDFGASADNLYRSAIMSMAAGAVALIIVTSLLGWWRPALFDSTQQRWTYKWPIIAPLFLLLGAIANLFSTNFSKFDAKFILILIIFGLLVGFCEELTYRGLLLTSLRSKLSEGWVCILTSIIFGLIHCSNIFLGQDISTTISQVFFAALMGLSLYIVRRVTGSLIWAMLLHGFWDVSVFMADYSSADNNSLGGLSVMIAAPLSIIFLIIVFRKIKKLKLNERVILYKCSERQLERDIQTNLAYHWFLGLGLTDKVPDHFSVSRCINTKRETQGHENDWVSRQSDDSSESLL